VGYGAQPDAVLSLIRQEEIPCLLGNHEEALFDEGALNLFNPSARLTIQKARELLSSDVLESLRDLPRSLKFQGALFVHGFPPDSVHPYLFHVPPDRMASAFCLLEQDLCFVGHTHLLELVGFDGKSVSHRPLAEGMEFLGKGKYIINAGSIGQPRDGNNNAKYLIWETEARSIEVRFVPYDTVSAARKIIDAGLPERCARRLL
jgi:diadenosine tetraphosphatase ApaH/serine/threonine PP2A family protein phosphatase